MFLFVFWFVSGIITCNNVNNGVISLGSNFPFSYTYALNNTTHPDVNDLKVNGQCTCEIEALAP